MATISSRAGKRFVLRGNRSGAAYILALTTLVVGVTFSLAMLQASGSYFLTERSQGYKQMAMDMAEAGIDYAFLQVNKHNQSVPYDFPTVTLASGSFHVSVADNASDGTMLITSTGTVKGATYTVRRVTKGALLDKIMDNLDPGFSCSATWTVGTMATDKYSTDYRWHSTGAGSDPASWTINLPTTGKYDLYAWWPKGTNRSVVAPYLIPTSTGQVTVTVNQQQNGGKWNLLGRYSFNSGNNSILLSYWAPGGFVVCADAIRVTGPYP